MRKIILVAIAAMATTPLAATKALAEQVWLTMDQVRPYTFKQEVSQIVVGNPGIADVSVRDKTRVLLFGKAPGLTNMFLLDAEGNEIENLIVRVRSSNSDMLTFQRGGQRTTYNCMSNCEATLTVGDSPDTFGSVQTQVQQKIQQAVSGTTPSE